jgi:hypothetical protein
MGVFADQAKLIPTKNNGNLTGYKATLAFASDNIF